MKRELATIEFEYRYEVQEERLPLGEHITLQSKV